MHIDRSVRFFIHKRKDAGADGYVIRMRVTIGGDGTTDISTPYKATDEQWDAKTMRVRRSHSENVRVNLLLSQWDTTAAEIFARYELVEKRVPTCAEFSKVFKTEVGIIRQDPKISGDTGKSDMIYEVMNEFVAEQSSEREWTDGTVGKFRAIRRRLQEHYPKLRLSEVTSDLLAEYTASISRIMKSTTVNNHIVFIKWFLRWAHRKGYYNGDAHDTFNPRLKGGHFEHKEIVFLTIEELQKLEAYEFPPSQQALERVRDVFVFQCYTGLRYSDACALKRSSIHNGVIELVTRKTDDRIQIHLNRHSQAILEKYSKCRFAGDKALPTISNVKANEHLKTIGRIVGLDTATLIVYYSGNERHEEVHPKWQLLTTHCARRTFVTTALQLGIPSEVIIRITGHSQMRSLKPYLAVVDKLKEESMSRFDRI